MAKRKTASAPKKRGRKSKAESMTGAKSAEVEVRVGGLDLPVIELDPKDINVHFKAIKRATEQKDTYVSLLRGAKKNANQLYPGLAAEIEDHMKNERKNDPSALLEKLALKGVVMKAVGSSIQLTAFDSLAGDHADQVAKRFYIDGKAGRTFDCRYPETSDLFAVARENWTRGQAEILGVDTDEQSETSDQPELPEYDVKSPAGLDDADHALETAH